MSSLRISRTGIPLLDSMLGGGYLSNSIVVVSYQPGVKTRHFGFHLGLNKYKEDLHIIVATFHYSIEEIMDWVNGSMTNPELYKKVKEILPIGKISVIDGFSMSESKVDSNIFDVHYVSNPFNVDSLLSVMSEVRENIPEGKHACWIFYGLTNMSIGVPENELIKFCRRAFRYHKQHGDQAFYYVNREAHTDMFFAKLYQLSDVFINLNFEEDLRIPTSIQVIKGVFPFQSKKVFYVINENGEIQFDTDKIEKVTSPPSKISSTYFDKIEEREKSRFFVTGIPKLDFLLGGGIPFNSIIVISQDYGLRLIEPLANIFRKLSSEKISKIHINFHYSPEEYVNLVKKYEETSGIETETAESFSKGELIFIDCFNTYGGQNDTEEGNIYTVSNPFNVDSLLSVMTRVRNKIPEDKLVFWIMDDLTEMSVGVPENELIMFCRRAFRYQKWRKDMALYIINEHAHSKIFLAKLHQLSDVYIRFLGKNTPEGIETNIQILKAFLNFDPKKTKYRIDEKSQMWLEE